jgi:hypothetical protein
MPFFLRLIPESPSWLLVVGQQEKAMNQLRIVAKINRKNFQAGFFISKKTNRLSGMLRSGIFVTQPVCPIYFAANHQHVNMSKNVASRSELNKLTHLSTLANQNQFLLFLRVT